MQNRTDFFLPFSVVAEIRRKFKAAKRGRIFVLSVERRKASESFGVVSGNIAFGAVAFDKAAAFLGGHNVVIKLLACGDKQEAASFRVDSVQEAALHRFFSANI